VLFTRLLPFVLSFAVLSGTADAQNTQVAFGATEQDTSLPVEVTADSLDINQTTGTAIFSDNVLIVQGEMRLSAQRVLVVYSSDAQSISKLEATGGVTLVSGDDAAESERADYRIDDGLIVMTGNVLVSQGPSAIRADTMSIRLEDGTAEMSGRVKTILQTGDQ
jgi:lipopolysaccharide export system protein LptA